MGLTALWSLAQGENMPNIAVDRFANRPVAQLRFTNNSAVSLIKGDIVVADPILAAPAVGCTTSVTYGDDTVIGICLGNAIVGQDIDVCFSGVVVVNLKSGVTAYPGDRIVTSTSAGKADVSAPDGYGASDPVAASIIGTAVQHSVSGQVLCLIHKS